MQEAPINLGQLESHLWESANILRGPVDGVLYNLDSQDDVPAAINVVRQAYERVTE